MHIAFLLLAHAFIHILVSPAINDMEDVSYIAAEHRVVASFSTKFLKLTIFISYHSMYEPKHIKCRGFCTHASFTIVLTISSTLVSQHAIVDSNTCKIETIHTSQFNS